VLIGDSTMAFSDILAGDNTACMEVVEELPELPGL